jgi:hypothetical protein
MKRKALFDSNSATTKTTTSASSTPSLATPASTNTSTNVTTTLANTNPASGAPTSLNANDLLSGNGSLLAALVSAAAIQQQQQQQQQQQHVNGSTSMPATPVSAGQSNSNLYQSMQGHLKQDFSFDSSSATAIVSNFLSNVVFNNGNNGNNNASGNNQTPLSTSALLTPLSASSAANVPINQVNASNSLAQFK